MTRQVVIGSFTLDDTVLPSNEVRRRVNGGNALYAVIGSRVWSRRVGVVTRVGNQFPSEDLEAISDHHIDTTGIRRKDAQDIRLWILYEEGMDRQIIYQLKSGSIKDLSPQPADWPESYQDVRYVHLCGIPFKAQMQWINKLKPLGIEFTLDLLPMPQLRSAKGLELLKSGNLLREISVFLPSLEEVVEVWGGQPLLPLMYKLAEYGPKVVAVKLGSLGSLVLDAEKNSAYLVPAMSVETIDTTGAGDAYCGGFLAGMDQTGDPLEAALRATISASFIIQDFGAVHGLNAQPSEARNRLEILRGQVTDKVPATIGDLKVL